MGPLGSMVLGWAMLTLPNEGGPWLPAGMMNPEQGGEPNSPVALGWPCGSRSRGLPGSSVFPMSLWDQMSLIAKRHLTKARFSLVNGFPLGISDLFLHELGV